WARELDRGHPRDLGRDGAHEHARGVTGLAPRSVDARAVDRAHAAREEDFVLLVSEGGELRLLVLVVGVDPLGGRLQGAAEVWGQTLEGGLSAVVSNEEGVRASTFELLHVAAKSRVPFPTYVGQDLAHDGLDSIEVRVASRSEGPELDGKFRGGLFEQTQGGHSQARFCRVRCRPARSL